MIKFYQEDNGSKFEVFHGYEYGIGTDDEAKGYLWYWWSTSPEKGQHLQPVGPYTSHEGALLEGKRSNSPTTSNTQSQLNPITQGERHERHTEHRNGDPQINHNSKTDDRDMGRYASIDK